MTNIKIIFKSTRNVDEPSGSENNEIERIANVRLSISENDLIERRRYDFETCMQNIKAKKIQGKMIEIYRLYIDYII